MRQKPISKFAAMVMAAITAFSPIASALPTYADDMDESIIPTGSEEIKIEAEANDETGTGIVELPKGVLLVDMKGNGGTLTITSGDDVTVLSADEEGHVKATDKDGKEVTVKPENGYVFAVEATQGTVVKTRAAAEDGYKVATYAVQTDSGTEQQTSVASVESDIVVEGTKLLSVTFEVLEEPEVVQEEEPEAVLEEQQEAVQEEEKPAEAETKSEVKANEKEDKADEKQENDIIEEDASDKSLEELAEEAGIPKFSLTAEEEDCWRTFCSLTGVDYDGFYKALELEYYERVLKENNVKGAEELVGLSGDTIAGVDKGKTKQITYSEGQWIPYGSHGTAYRSADGLTGNATCIMPSLGSTGGGTYTGYAIKNATLRNLMFTAPGAYGYNNSAAVRQAYTNLTGTEDIMQHYVLWHLAMSFAYNTIIYNELGFSDSAWTAGAGPDWVNRAQSLAVWVDNSMSSGTIPTTPADFECYIFNTSAGTQPMAVYYNYTPSNGSVKLVKKTAKGYEAITKNNPCYDLTGTTYELYNSATNKKVGTLVCKADGTSNTIKDLPAGDYYAIETKSGQGYKLSKDKIDFTLKASQNYTITAYDIPGNDPFGITMIKKDADTKKVVEATGGEFTVKYYALNVYDTNYRTVADLNKAAGGKATRTWVLSYKEYTDPETNQKAWGANFLTINKDRSSALYYDENGNACIPHGYVTIEETKAPAGYSLEGKTISGNGGVVDNGVLISKVYSNHVAAVEADHTLTATDKSVSLKTTAIDTRTNSQQLDNKNHDIVINDTVEYSGVTPGVKYRLTGTLMTSDGEPAVDADGKTVIGRAWFTPETDHGTVVVPFEFSISEKQAKELAGKNYVVFERLYVSGTNERIQIHEDLSDKGQTIYIPGVKTEAKDAETGMHTGNADKDVTIIDKVTCTNLIVGKTYTVTGTLMDKETGKEILIGGKPVTAEPIEFTADKANCVVEMTFKFNGTSLAGKTVVVFEDLKHEGIEVATHADLNDENQTVWYPKLGTTALDETSKSHQASIADDGKVHIVDTVKYENVTVGETYKLVGYVVEKATGNAVTDKITQTLTPTAEDGSVKMNFIVDPSQADASAGLVVFERLLLVKDGKEEVVAIHENLNDSKQTVSLIEIETQALDETTKSQVMARNTSVTLSDTVTYSGLTVGKEHVLTGRFVDKTTGETLKDKDGNDVTATKTFTPASANGTEVMEFQVTFTEEQLDALAGKTLVAFETLECDGKEVAVHADLEDEAQAIYVPKVSTSATDAKTGTHAAKAEKEVTIIDKVSCTNLIVGKEYTVSGTLMDKATGKALLVNGQEVKSEPVTFTAKKANTTVDITFKFDGSGLAGKTVVVFEDLKYEGIEVATHADITDKEQTIWFPSIGTTALDAENQTHQASIKEDGTVSIVDTVAYKNLIAGTKYRISGYVVNKATGKAVTEKVVKNFTPKAADGSQSMTFEVNVSDLNGSSELVVFEKLYILNDGAAKEVAVHEDINDEGQTVVISEIHTDASDAKTKDEVVARSTELTLTDDVSYKGLVPGKEYTLTGRFVYQNDGEALKDKDGKEVTATKTFTPTASEGTETMSFTVNLTEEQLDELAGKTCVAFETLESEGKQIAVHADLNDEKQTIFVPKVETEAIDQETGTHAANADEEVTIIDAVTCTNLVVGKEYTVSGVLMEKITHDDGTVEEKELLVDGKKVVSEPVTFTAEKANEVKEITFKFNGVSLAGKTVVAFETLEHKGIEVAVHKDINDTNQTIWFPRLKTTATDAATGTDSGSVGANGKVKLVDTIKYENVIPGQAYRMAGYVVDKATGKAISQTVYKDFTPEEANGTETMNFTVDAKKAKDLVVFESLYLVNEDEKLVADHEDINDESQTVHMVEIGTKATDASTKDQIMERSTTVTLEDTVSYKNLTVGKEYTVTGTFHDKETGNAILDADGKEVEATTTFKPEKADGEVVVRFKDVTFTEEQLDALAEKCIVAFETLYYDGKQIAVHADLTDEEQTIFVPKVETEAIDQETNTKNSNADEEVAIIDSVTCTNLIVGKEYTVSGVLMEKVTDENGNPVLDENGKQVEKELLTADGKNVVSEPVTFTAEKANEVKEITFKFNGVGLEGKTIVAFETLEYKGIEVAVHKDITDKEQTVWVPKISTTAKDAEIEIQNENAAKDQQLVDTIAYKNLLPNTTYVFEGMLMDKETGKAVMNDGKPVTAKAEHKTGAAEEGKHVVSGTADVTFKYDATGLANHTLVVFEKAYIIPDGNVPEGDIPETQIVATHEDIEDAPQSVYIPEIRTHAKDAASDSKTGLPQGVQTIKDEVTYKNLLPDTEYTMEGSLVIKSTGKAVELVDEAQAPTDASMVDESTLDAAEGTVTGKQTETVTFRTPAAKDGEKTVSGSVVLTFHVNASELAGETVVAFEKLLYKGKILAVHADINDEDQSVHYPKIRTSLVDKADKDKLVLADGKAVVVDTISYNNLDAGKKYKAQATLMDKATGKAILVENKPVTANVEFTADKSGNGTVDVEIAFDASKLANKTLVAFEKLFTVDTNVEIANHEDIKDVEQTVYVPEIGTTLVDKADSDKLVLASKDAVVSDTVAYKNLIPGEKYKAVATLWDKETNKQITINNKPITGETEFTAEKANGSVVVNIAFDASALAGHDVVAFEKVYTAKGNVECAKHEDIKDESQTVHIPKIGTVLKNKGDGTKTVTASNSVTLTDTVEYTNLIAGKKYKVSGRLMDKSTGKELVINGKTITAEKTFTADKESGSVTLDFTFNANGLGGKSVVAFEKMYTADGKIEIGVHEDINDANQTVSFKAPPTSTTPPPTTKVQTGDDNVMFITGGIGIILLLAAVVLVIARRRKRA